MKQCVAIGMKVVFGLTGLSLLAGSIYDFCGLGFKSLKDHGYDHFRKGEKRPSILSKERFETTIEAGKHVMEDVIEGWEWRLS